MSAGHTHPYCLPLARTVSSLLLQSIMLTMATASIFCSVRSAPVGIRPPKDLLIPQLSHKGKAKRQSHIWPKEVGLWPHAGHDLCPLGHHGIAFALHLICAGIQQDGEAVEQLRSLLGLHSHMLVIRRMLPMQAGCALMSHRCQA